MPIKHKVIFLSRIGDRGSTDELPILDRHVADGWTLIGNPFVPGDGFYPCQLLQKDIPSGGYTRKQKRNQRKSRKQRK
jgi:hypothetical protein